MDLHTHLLVLFIYLAILSLADCENYDRKYCPTIVQNSPYYVATHDNTCYVFVSVEKYWDEARSDCWRMGGEMLHVHDMATMNFIKGQLSSRELDWNNNGVWNGASDLRSNGWEWTTGESLKYDYWAEGEPSKVLGFLSLENCCCMRRSDGWRWHDYHCHMDGYEYKSICQFPFVNKETDTLNHHTDRGAPLQVKGDDTVAIIGLAIGGLVLLLVLCAVIIFLYRKHERQKAQLERPIIRFQNTGYATIIQNVSRDNTEEDSRSTRPVSNVYLDPVEVSRIYEEVNKDTDHGVNSLNGDSESTRLVYTGGAAPADDMEGGYLSNTPSEASGATSGYCSTTDRKSGDSEYIEMNGANGIGRGNESTMPTPCGGATGFGPVSNSKAMKNGAFQKDDKASNIYVTPCKNSADDKMDNKSVCSKDKSSSVEEMHIYTNQLEAIDGATYTPRPLPPLPAT